MERESRRDVRRTYSLGVRYIVVCAVVLDCLHFYTYILFSIICTDNAIYKQKELIEKLNIYYITSQLTNFNGHQFIYSFDTFMQNVIQSR